MKPPPFEYYSPTTLDEALSLLGEYGAEAKVLAGGQSLVPSMNFRLAQPAVLVDLNRIPDLAGIRATGQGTLQIGAMTRQRELERSPEVSEHAPLIYETMPFIAHPQIRNRGTIGGSLAHADPSAELPAVAVALNCSIRARSPRGERVIPAAEFFLGVFTTALEPDEIITEIEVPRHAHYLGAAFEEVARRHGDYALAGAAAAVALHADGTVAEVRLVFLSLGDGPVECPSVYAILLGQTPTEEAVREAVEALEADIDPPTDIHASSAYRRHLARVLGRRTLTKAVERASARQ